MVWSMKEGVMGKDPLYEGNDAALKGQGSVEIEKPRRHACAPPSPDTPSWTHATRHHACAPKGALETSNPGSTD